MGLIRLYDRIKGRREAEQKQRVSYDRWHADTKLKLDKFDYTKKQGQLQEIDLQHKRDIVELKHIEGKMTDPNKKDLITREDREYYKKLKWKVYHTGKGLDEVDGILKDAHKRGWDKYIELHRNKLPVLPQRDTQQPQQQPTYNGTVPYSDVTPKTSIPAKPMNETDVAMDNLRNRQAYEFDVSSAGKEADVAVKNQNLRKAIVDETMRDILVVEPERVTLKGRINKLEKEIGTREASLATIEKKMVREKALPESKYMKWSRYGNPIELAREKMRQRIRSTEWRARFETKTNTLRNQRIVKLSQLERLKPGWIREHYRTKWKDIMKEIEAYETATRFDELYNKEIDKLTP